jgi:hypothetical protein
MSDPVIEMASKVAVNLTTEVFQSCFRELGRASDWIRSKNKERDPLGLAAKRYCDKVEELYNVVRIFGMSKPVPLRSVYTRVNILERITARYRATVEELEHVFDRDRIARDMSQRGMLHLEVFKEENL